MTGATQRVALITGCGKQSGIGAEIARRLAARGVAIVVTDAVASGVKNQVDQNADGAWRGLPSLVEELTELGAPASSVIGDISIEDDAQHMVDKALDEYGRLDILINNAGAPQGNEYGDIEEVPVEAWDRVMSINLRGTFLMTRAAVSPMRANNWGRILNVSSLTGRTGFEKQAAYSASKAGIIGMTRSVARDLARDGITVNAVTPGQISTSRAYNSAHRVAAGVQEELMRRAERIPIGRLGTPQDVAVVLDFLASEAAGYLTGQIYDIDGGLLMA